VAVVDQMLQAIAQRDPTGFGAYGISYSAEASEPAADEDGSGRAAGGGGSVGQGSVDEGSRPWLLVWSEWWQPRRIRITRLLLLLGWPPMCW